MEVRTGRPLSDDAGSEGYVFIAPMRNAEGPPQIDVLHAHFFDCASDDKYTAKFGEGPHPALSVTKNVYNLTPVFLHLPAFVVNAVVRDMLASCCTVEFREVVIQRAFWFPYGPADTSYEMAGVSLEGSTEKVVERFATAYACPAPRERYYRVVAPSGFTLGSSYSDVQTVRVGVHAPKGTSVYSREAVVSRQMIEEHGLVFDRCYLCRPDVFDLLNPYLHRPWFWAQRYAYD